jgi:phosphoribosylaminoimidazolecarboxamide formyltransferase/IMP cyclohydrolase
VAVNRQLDGPTAELITQIFTEVVVAPSVSDEAKDVFTAKKNLRLLITGEQSPFSQSNLMVKTLRGGFLLQNRDQTWADPEAIRCVTQRQASASEAVDLEFAFKVAKHVKSNAIVLVKDGRTVGIGAGQMSRVDAARIATWKAGDQAQGCVLASDAFFPFADGIQMAIGAGAKAVIQPGGSMRDDEVIKAADAAGLAMLFTGMRHFNH